MDDQKTIERLDEDSVVRRDGGARLAVVRVLLDEALRAGLVDRPRLLKVLDRLRHALPVESRVDLLADPTDALGEAERDGEHLAVPAGDDCVRIRDRGHVHHAVLPDLLHLPRPAPDDEVQSFASLDHHELLAKDADLPLRREVHDRVAALVTDRRQILEIVAPALRRDADLVAFLTQVAEMGHELGDAIRLDVFEFAKRLGAADRREDIGQRSHASQVDRGANDLVGKVVEGEAMYVQRLEFLVPRRLDRRERFDRIVRGDREDQPSGGSIQFVARSSDPLDEGRDLPRRVVLDDLIDRPDVDPELEGGRRHEPFDVSAFESGLDALPFLAGEGAVVDGDVLSEHREARTEELGQRAGVHEDERGAALVERIVDRGEPGCRLRGDVEVSGGLEILVDRAGPLDAVFVPLLEGSHQDFERVLTAKEGRDRCRVADGRGEPDTLEAIGDRTQAFQSDGELDSSAIARELMDFVDDDVFDVLQMTLHDLPRQNRLERLGGRNEDVRRSRGLFPPCGWRSVAMAHRSRQTRPRYEVLNPINHVTVESPQRRNVKGANSGLRAG